MSRRGEYAAAAEVEADEKKPGQKRAFMETDEELSGVRDKVHAGNRHEETVAGLLASIQGWQQAEEQVRRRYLVALDKLMADSDALAAEAGDVHSNWENVVEILLRQMRELQALRSTDLRELAIIAPRELIAPGDGKGSGWGKSSPGTGGGGGGWGGSS